MTIVLSKVLEKMTIVLSKVLEKVVHNKLSRYLQFHEMLYESQYGFRKHHSTVHGVAEFMHHNVKDYDDQKHTVTVFCLTCQKHLTR